MMRTIKDARILIKENRIIDAKNTFKNILNTPGQTLQTQKECLVEIININEILGIKFQMNEMRAQLVCIYYELKEFRSAINCFESKDPECLLTGGELKALTYSFALEGEIYKFTKMLDLFIEYLKRNKFFHALGELQLFLDGRLKTEAIDELLFGLYILSGDEKSIEIILDRVLTKSKKKYFFFSDKLKRSLVEAKEFYSKKIPSFSFFSLYMRSLLPEISNQGLDFDKCKIFAKLLFDSHVFYPQQIEVLKYGIEYSIITKNKLLGKVSLEVVKRNFKNLKRTDLLFFKSTSEQIILMDENKQTQLVKKGKEEIDKTAKEVQINSVPEVMRIDEYELVQFDHERPEIIISINTIYEQVTLKSYSDIFILLFEMGYFKESLEILSLTAQLLKDETIHSKEVLLKHKINIQYLKIECLFAQGKYDAGIRIADTTLISYPLTSDEQVTFLYLIAEGRFHLNDFETALKYYGLVKDYNISYRIVRMRIGQIEQDK